MLSSLVLVLALCTPALAQPENAAIDRFFQSFTEDWLRLDPRAATGSKVFPPGEQLKLDGLLTEVTPEHTQQQLALITRAQAELRKFDLSRVSRGRRVAAKSLAWNFDEILRDAPLLGHRYILSQFITSAHIGVTELPERHPFRSRADAGTYLARLSRIAGLTDQWMAQSAAAEAKDIVAPKRTLELTSKQIKAFIEPAPEKNMWVTTPLERIKPEDRAEFAAKAAALVEQSVYPAWRKLAVFLDAQAQRAPAVPGIWKLPQGDQVYRSKLRWYTTTDLSPDAIHDLGLKEVSRIEAEMDRLLRKLGLAQGTVQARCEQLTKRPGVAYAETPDVRERVLADYAKIVTEAEARVATAFRLPESRPVVVRRMAAYREAETKGVYQAPPQDSDQPGVFSVALSGPAFERMSMRSLTFHETIPGHHFQALYRQQQSDGPAFRKMNRFGSVEGRSLGHFPGYSEGWGLYAETLADEMGLYEGDDVARVGYLRFDLYRAARLVVDTGMHAKRWPRERALAYLKLREPVPGWAEPEIDRYIADPGQACAYKIGQLKILELRAKAKKALGARFDLKDFHAVVLGGGNVPLPVLEELVDEYIRSGKN